MHNDILKNIFLRKGQNTHISSYEFQKFTFLKDRFRRFQIEDDFQDIQGKTNGLYIYQILAK